jgi:hypothetical protein
VITKYILKSLNCSFWLIFKEFEKLNGFCFWINDWVFKCINVESISIQKSFFRSYLKFVQFLIIVNLPLGVIGTFGEFRDFTTYLFLVPMLILDTFFIFLNIRRLKFNLLELILIFLLIFSLLIGLFHYPLSKRILPDVTNPLYFILKIGIIRICLKEKDDSVWLLSFVKKTAFLLIVSGFFSIVVFIILSRIKSMYAGLTPTTHPFLILGLLNASSFNQLFSLIIALLSGKRALLVSSLVIMIVYRFYIKRNFKTALYLLFSFVFIYIALVNLKINTDSIGALEKYNWTFEVYKESEIQFNLEDESGIIDLLSGGRLAEIKSAIKGMDLTDYIIGNGIGFTYIYKSDLLEFDIQGNSNLHFTPLSIVTKYGLVFLFFLLLYIFKTLYSFRSNGYLSIFFGLYVIATLVDMLFAYVIFVDPLIPIALGYLSFNKYPTIGKRVEKF